MPDNQKEIFTVLEDNIRLAAKQMGINLNELISEIDMTEGGFYKMLSAKSMKITTLKKIADALNMPIAMFFESGKTVQKIKGNYNTQTNNSHLIEPNAGSMKMEVEGLKKQIALLESQIADKDKIIELLGIKNR